jgi:hypothetical protein
MIDARVKELLAMFMIGEGVLALLYPRRHALLWKVGPRSLRELTGEFARRPGLTRGLAAAEVGLGLWMASRQLSRSA